METTSELRVMAKAGALALVLVGALGGALSCASGSKDTIDITKPVDATKPVTGVEASNAEKAYRKGLEEKSSSNFIDATKYFEYVRNNFPYSQYAALSELALADMYYERDEFGSAAAAYGDFVKSHPSHPKADYAAYRIGLAHFADRSSEMFVYPPAHEKDQAPVRAALEALQKFEHVYPKSELLPDARRLMDECRSRLADHARYVANFYWKRKAWKGAAGRYLELADAYGDLDSGRVRTDALWRAAQSLKNAEQTDDEKLVLQRVLEDAPNGPHRQEAEQRLAELSRPVVPDVAAPRDPTPAPAKVAPEKTAVPEAPGDAGDKQPGQAPAAQP